MDCAPNRWGVPSKGWSFLQFGDEWIAYQNSYGYVALSSVTWVENGYMPGHWEWLISFTGPRNKRVNNRLIKRFIKEWNLKDFEEDNHGPGTARKFWLAVEEDFRAPCPCKDEMIIREGDYEYSIKT